MSPPLSPPPPAPAPTQSPPSAHPPLPPAGTAVLVSPAACSASCLWIGGFVPLKMELPLGMGHSVIGTALYQEDPTGVFLIAQ